MRIAVLQDENCTRTNLSLTSLLSLFTCETPDLSLVAVLVTNLVQVHMKVISVLKPLPLLFIIVKIFQPNYTGKNSAMTNTFDKLSQQVFFSFKPDFQGPTVPRILASQTRTICIEANNWKTHLL